MSKKEKPVVTIDREFLDEIIDRMERIEDPDDTLDSVEFIVNGVIVKVL
jgi:hypothetical protein